MFHALTRANRAMQLESWTPVVIDMATMIHIHKTQGENMVQPADDLKSTAVYIFLDSWCREHIHGGHAPRRELASLNDFGSFKMDEPCLTFLFKHSSEAVRFKLTWGGR